MWVLMALEQMELEQQKKWDQLGVEEKTWLEHERK
jgi:hypothetical protein